MEAYMKLTIPGIMISALILSSSAALAQNTNYQGTTSKPGASFQKDDATVAPTGAKKHVASSKKKHHSKRMKSNAQTTGSGNSSNPAAATTKDDVTPKSR
jgi:Tfp pilus assembly major pilin PilA